MPNIQILSPLVADMIAAGEVVERPGSVIKELMENAVDAGAKNITVELRGGGSAYIRVTDDGCGMSPEDAGVAFLRHATSKLSSERGLEAIGTLGFRGEALAAISAVSRIELTTREAGAETGSFVALEAGDIQEMRPAGCPNGTTMIVRDLFFNTPARFKFLKSDRTEAQNCVNVALRCALAHPDVSVKCIKDGESVFFSPGDGRMDSCVYSLLGRDAASGLLHAESEGNGVTVTGFVSSPRAGRGNRSAQYFFCNGRPIHSLSLQTALEQAYKNTLMVGRFPACVLYITLSCAAVDVNVHPTKNEVKFSDEHSVFDGVYHAALGALEKENPLPSRTSEASAPKFVHEASKGEQLRFSTSGHSSPATSAPRADFYRQMRAEEFRNEVQSGKLKLDDKGRGSTSVHAPQPPFSRPETIGIERRPASATLPSGIEKPANPAPEQQHSPMASIASPSSVPVISENDAEEPVRLVGEAFDCYILVQQGETLTLIDKHAAHERILFDKLKAQKRSIMSQSLLVPVTLSPGAGDAELLMANAPMLDQFGFELEAFGSDSVVLRAIPADTDESEARAMLEEILEKLHQGSSPDRDSVLDEILHTIACKAAIKAGRSSTPEELLAIAKRVLSGEIRYCPHGRPVSHAVMKKDLDKRFGRLG